MTKPEYDKVGIKKALGELVSAWQPAIASEAVVQARREAEAKVWAEVDAVFQLGAATTASPVQGAASATKQEDIASRAMMSAHALCPTDMAHPDRMRWMAKFILEKLASVDGQGGATPDNSGPINHAEAYELACAKRDKSNLARCYLDLRAALAERAQAQPSGAVPDDALKDLWIHEDMARDAADAVTSLPRKDLKAAYKQLVEDVLYWQRRALTSEASKDATPAPAQPSSKRFEAWWEEHGQFVRAGGGDYEKCFACAAWNYAAPVAQEAAQPQGTGPSTTACDDQYRSAHVCGLQGYGAAGDECPGCATAKGGAA